MLATAQNVLYQRLLRLTSIGPVNPGGLCLKTISTLGHPACHPKEKEVAIGLENSALALEVNEGEKARIRAY